MSSSCLRALALILWLYLRGTLGLLPKVAPPCPDIWPPFISLLLVEALEALPGPSSSLSSQKRLVSAFQGKMFPDSSPEQIFLALSSQGKLWAFSLHILPDAAGCSGGNGTLWSSLRGLLLAVVCSMLPDSCVRLFRLNSASPSLMLFFRYIWACGTSVRAHSRVLCWRLGLPLFHGPPFWVPFSLFLPLIATSAACSGLRAQMSCPHLPVSHLYTNTISSLELLAVWLWSIELWTIGSS